MDNNLTFGQWLKRRRRGLGLTQRSLGLQTSYASETLRKVEADELRPSSEMAERLADALQIEPADRARFVRFARDEPGGGDHVLSTQTVQLESGAEARRHNLPAALTTLIGREQEIGVITALLGTRRLVSLTGLGGIGKTRLALRVAEDALGQFSAGAYLVELAALVDPALVAQETMAALGLRDATNQPAQETLTHFLRDRELLLVLDNCEHVLSGCAPLAHALLRACPGVKILATSREPLGVGGEMVFMVPSLPWPAASDSDLPEHMAGFASVGLFIDRARLVQPEFELTPHNAHAVAGICRRLEGLALAIEMAAARLNTLSAEQLAARLDDAFRLLTSSSRTAPPRQQTLRATLDWSYDLLSSAQRLLFYRLAVFAGGCTLEAAEAVCASQELPPDDVLDLLASLVARSLVVAVRQPDGETRYRLLEMVRQYALEKLESAGERQGVHRRHRDYFVEFATTGAPSSHSKDHLAQTRLMQRETENFRSALEWSFANEDNLEAIPTLVYQMYGFWPSYAEDIAWSQRALTWCRRQPALPRATLVYMLHTAWVYACLNEPPAALELAKEAVEVSRTLGPAQLGLLEVSLLDLGETYLMIQDLTRAKMAFTEAEAIFESLAADHRPSLGPYRRAGYARYQADIALKQAHYAEARRHASESVHLLEGDGRRATAANADAHTTLGCACMYLGEYALARQHLLDAMAICDQLGGDDGLHRKSFAIRCLALLELTVGNLASAVDTCQRVIRRASSVADYNITASGLALAAMAAARQHQTQRAARLAGAAAAMYARQKRPPWEDSSPDMLFSGWRGGPQRDAIQAAYDAGQAMSSDNAIAYALTENEA